jgi:Leucine-rich repeat (LRR) protein
MLEFLPDETEVLIFTGNTLGFLFHNLLGLTQEHELLKVIDLSNNNITEISGKAFHKVSNVEILILNHNNLKITGIIKYSLLATLYYAFSRKNYSKK